MTTPPPPPLTATDLEAFLASQSDFAFEMRVLVTLREIGFVCRHAATYLDPVTSKTRQYDIRATLELNNAILALAVECKSLQPSFPLLLSAVPRTEAEAFHDILRLVIEGPTPHPSVRTIAAPRSCYRRNEMVAKQSDQVRKDRNNTYSSDDSATFDKISQAVNSSRDLITDMAWRRGAPFIRAVVPVLVVPDDTLWQVDYNSKGVVAAGPRQVPHSTMVLDRAWPIEAPIPLSYRLSHLEIVTLSGLRVWAETLAGRTGLFDPAGLLA